MVMGVAVPPAVPRMLRVPATPGGAATPPVSRLAVARLVTCTSYVPIGVVEETVLFTTALELSFTTLRCAETLAEAKEFIADCKEDNLVPSVLSWVFLLLFLTCSAW